MASDASLDVAAARAYWLAEAKSRHDIMYFAVRSGVELVGQFFLHDIDETSGEALVGYHLFAPRFRARGIGSTALKLLQNYVEEETTLRRVFAITDIGNSASRRIGAKCGFVEIGGSREDPEQTVVMEWQVPNRTKLA
jgi:RimJ/RimL family protein N-acetyltransferase